mmetsp:Transcript_30932/g.51087  ORF Transcript_30932/g.51087 Transcript_30932/m.51087 type:complete len:207 (-) Transcript_30932:11-631(-)
MEINKKKMPTTSAMTLSATMRIRPTRAKKSPMLFIRQPAPKVVRTTKPAPGSHQMPSRKSGSFSCFGADFSLGPCFFCFGLGSSSSPSSVSLECLLSLRTDPAGGATSFFSALPTTWGAASPLEGLRPLPLQSEHFTEDRLTSSPSPLQMGQTNLLPLPAAHAPLPSQLAHSFRRVVSTKPLPLHSSQGLPEAALGGMASGSCREL